MAPVFFIREEYSMNKFFVVAGIFLVCSLMNLLNVYLTGNGFSLIMGIAWLAASAMIFIRARKMKNGDTKEEEK